MYEVLTAGEYARRLGEYCCTGGDCCGPGSWCCGHAGPHEHEED